jgi:hypothetical protein
MAASTGSFWPGRSPKPNVTVRPKVNVTALGSNASHKDSLKGIDVSNTQGIVMTPARPVDTARVQKK